MKDGFVRIGLICGQSFFTKDDDFQVYCIVKVGDKAQKSISKSEVQKKEEKYFVEWNQEFYFDVEREKDVIEFHFYDEDDKIGMVFKLFH
jgi:hypothetical protein